MKFKNFLNEKDEDFFDHSNPEHVRFMKELDFYTASPNIELSSKLKKFLRSRYKDESGRTLLWRLITVYNMEEFSNIFKVKSVDVKVGLSFRHTRNKESSWTKSQRHAYGFAEKYDLLDTLNIIIRSRVPKNNFLLDMDDLSRNDRSIITPDDQKEVIVDAGKLDSIVVKIM